MLYELAATALAISLLMICYLRKLAKHDRVLYRICQVRRNSMRVLREDYESLSKDEYVAIRNLIETLNITINNYNEHKTVLFNFRKFVIHIKEYKSFSERVEQVKIPANEKIKKIYSEAYIAYIKGFLSFTPFMKYELSVHVVVFCVKILTRLGVKRINSLCNDISDTFSSVQKHGHQLGV